MIKNTWKLYEWINKNPEHAIVGMMIEFGWSEKKVQRHLDKLINDGVVKMKMRYTDRLYYATPWHDMINWTEFKNFGE